MYIRSQNRVALIDMVKMRFLYIEPSWPENKKDQNSIDHRFKIYASFGGGTDPLLGEYENRERAISVLDSVCEMIKMVQPDYVFYMPIV